MYSLSEEAMFSGRVSSAGFSMRGLVLASTNPRRLKPALLRTVLLPRACDHFIHFVHGRFEIFGRKIRRYIAVRANERQT
jgi:hypothetical protein